MKRNKRNIWKVLLVFSVLLMFSFSSELAAQDNLGLTPETGNIGLEDSVKLTAVLTDGGVGVEALTINFELSPGLDGSSVPASGVTDEFGEVKIYYKAGTTSGIDTVEAMWTDEFSRLTLTDISIITVNPDAGTRINVTPAAKTVVVAQNATIVAEIQDKYANHVDAADPALVSFTHSGKGSLGEAGLNAAKNIAVAYTTDDSMVVTPADTVTAKLLVTGVTDYSLISTIGAAPDSVMLSTVDAPEVVVSDGTNDLDIAVQLLDQYGNPSGIINPAVPAVHYEVNFTVSAGGGSFNVSGPDRIEVGDNGADTIEYLSSMTAGVYTVTGTSDGASDVLAVTHKPEEPATIVLTPDNAGIPAGSDTTFVASATDQYDNHINMRLWYSDYPVVIEKVEGEGSITKLTFLEGDSLNWKATYTSYTEAADTAHIRAFRGSVADTVTLFSAEPGDFDHYAFGVLGDSSHVSDGNIYESNAVRIEAQDASNIRIWTYTNLDTVTLTLDGSAADSAQVVWYLTPPPITATPNGFKPDTAAVGLTAFIPENSFGSGEFSIGITNQIAETVPVTAVDTAGNTGTSSGLTWLPIGLAGFSVQIAGGLTTIHVNDTVDVEVTAIDMFGNVTDSLLPKIVDLSANKTGVEFPGETHLMQTAVTLFPTVATAQCTGLIITVFDLLEPSINGSSDPIEVVAAGVGEVPIVSNMSAKFGSGDILYSVAKAGKVDIRVYNKAGMEVGSLVNGVVVPGYYQTSLKGLNLSSDIYFVVMEGPGITKRIKATLIK